jgi:hypothetical protein
MKQRFVAMVTGKEGLVAQKNEIRAVVRASS